MSSPAARSSSRAPWLACLSTLVLLAGCATSGGTHPYKTATLDEAPLHDAVAEWEAEAAKYAPPPLPPRLALPPAASYELPEIELRAFSRSEAERIREVQPIVYAAASRHLVAPDLVNGIIWVE